MRLPRPDTLIFIGIPLGAFALMVYVASIPQPPRWESRCIKSHEEPYVSMETSPSGGGAPGGAYPVIRYDSVCDQSVKVCVKDPRWTKTPNRCRGEKP